MRFLKRFRTPKPTFSGPLRPEESFLAIGDIHGRDDLLGRLIPMMQERAPGLPMIFVGDYIDRGEDSAAVLTRLMEMQKADPEGVVCLRGNHEDMLLSVLRDPHRSGPRWLRYGGLQTMASFRVSPASETAPAEQWEEVGEKLRAAIGPELEAWLHALPTSWQSGNVTVLHAGADPQLPLEEQDEATLVWGHPDFMTTPRQDGAWVVHGHTVLEKARPQDGRIGIDTGAYATGQLTAALVAEGSVEFVQT